MNTRNLVLLAAAGATALTSPLAPRRGPGGGGGGGGPAGTLNGSGSISVVLNGTSLSSVGCVDANFLLVDFVGCALFSAKDGIVSIGGQNVEVNGPDTDPVLGLGTETFFPVTQVDGTTTSLPVLSIASTTVFTAIGGQFFFASENPVPPAGETATNVNLQWAALS